MEVRMDVPGDVRKGAVARTAYALRSRRIRCAVRRVDGVLIRFSIAPHGKAATAVVAGSGPKLLSAAEGAALKAAIA